MAKPPVEPRPGIAGGLAGNADNVRDLLELRVQIVLHGERRVFDAVTLGERIELHEDRRLVRAVIGEAEADAGGDRLDLRHLQHHPFDPLDDGGRLVHRGLIGSVTKT